MASRSSPSPTAKPKLRARWGRDGARVIMDTSGAKIWLPGISDPATLEAASTLCGAAAMREHCEDRHTSHPVMTCEMIRQLPEDRSARIDPIGIRSVLSGARS